MSTMSGSQQPDDALPKRGILARPLDALVFLLPLIVFSEIGSLIQPDRVIAFVLLRRFFELFGYVGMLAPGLGVVVILIATHIASGERWVVHWNRVGLMYLEAVGLCFPLLALNLLIPLTAAENAASPLLGWLALSIGAGIYEELIFRLVLISLLVIIGGDLLRFGRTRVALTAIVLSSLVFAAHHHQPIGAEPFDLVRFCFRTVAGVYLAIIFWFRGYGSAAGCHAAYNVALIAITPYDA
jgi:membrane protease YdiL (CAAX protease family)